MRKYNTSSRVLYSLSGNIARAGLSFITGILIAKGLGPESFGVFGFLLASFTVLTQLLDFGSSSAFSTFISKRARSLSYLIYYLVWLFFQFSILFAFIYLLAPDSVVQQLWQGEDRELVTVAFIAVFLQQKGWMTISQIGESQRFTKQVQLVSVLLALVHFAIISFLVVTDSISIELIYWVIAAEFICGILLALYILPLQYSATHEPFKAVLSQYKTYCLPLIPNAWVMILCMFADTWMLQFYGGAIEQAFYTVAMQFSVICLIATRSILSILWKEVAEAFAEDNLSRVSKLFSRSTRWLHGFGAFIACFLIPWTTQIIELSLGAEYLAGALAMAIMFLYPIDQARGQVAGTMLLAMERTKVTLIIGVTSSIVGLIVTYFMVAPPSEYIPGLGLGSVGLAIKMVTVQFLTVNISLWWIAKILNLKESNNYQYYVLMIFLVFGYFSFYTVNFILGSTLGVFGSFVLSGLLYSSLVFIVIYCRPELFLIDKLQKQRVKYILVSFFQGIRK